MYVKVACGATHSRGCAHIDYTDDYLVATIASEYAGALLAPSARSATRHALQRRYRADSFRSQLAFHTTAAEERGFANHREHQHLLLESEQLPVHEAEVFQQRDSRVREQQRRGRGREQGGTVAPSVLRAPREHRRRQQQPRAGDCQPDPVGLVQGARAGGEAEQSSEQNRPASQPHEGRRREGEHGARGRPRTTPRADRAPAAGRLCLWRRRFAALQLHPLAIGVVAGHVHEQARTPTNHANR
jgi:hypothetical protein